jgi:hypothetical protein
LRIDVFRRIRKSEENGLILRGLGKCPHITELVEELIAMDHPRA